MYIGFSCACIQIKRSEEIRKYRERLFTPNTCLTPIALGKTLYSHAMTSFSFRDYTNPILSGSLGIRSKKLIFLGASSCLQAKPMHCALSAKFSKSEAFAKLAGACIHAPMHLCMRTNIHASMHQCIHACVHTCAHTHTYMQILIQMQTRMRADTDTDGDICLDIYRYKDAATHVNIHMYLNVLTCVYIYIYIYIYRHIYTW